jgi:hypothetical protein
MKVFKVEITEILQKRIQVEANSLDEALKKVKLKYQKEQIILDSSDLIEMNILPVIDEECNDKQP